MSKYPGDRMTRVAALTLLVFGAAFVRPSTADADATVRMVHPDAP
jgi:hypothetical protein